VQSFQQLYEKKSLVMAERTVLAIAPENRYVALQHENETLKLHNTVEANMS